MLFFLPGASLQIANRTSLILWNEIPLNLNMSYGIVKIEPGIDMQDTMAMADNKMYQQKESVKKL
jgi:PleD family two-component response regulator